LSRGKKKKTGGSQGGGVGDAQPRRYRLPLWGRGRKLRRMRWFPPLPHAQPRNLRFPHQVTFTQAAPAGPKGPTTRRALWKPLRQKRLPPLLDLSAYASGANWNSRWESFFLHPQAKRALRSADSVPAVISGCGKNPRRHLFVRRHGDCFGQLHRPPAAQPRNICCGRG